MPRPLTRLVALATGTLTAVALLTVATPAATAAPPVPARLTSAIEPLADYVGQVSCDPTTRPGTTKLANLLTRSYPAARSWSSTYACGTDGRRSEHYDGRAVDWMTSVRDRSQRDAANAAIAWLLASDRQGNRYAMARRLGVMYIIWNNRMWGGWSGQWEDYNSCAKHPSRADDNWCHRTHVHISLSWNGAMGRTTYWTNRVSPTDYGPCRAAGMNWAPRYARANLTGCPDAPRVSASRGASKTKRDLVTYSGAELSQNSRGPAVSAVQSALRQSNTGRYDTSTVTAVRRFQAAKGLRVSGVMTTSTLQALLAATK